MDQSSRADPMSEFSRAFGFEAPTGTTIAAVARIFYLHNGALNRNVGALELELLGTAPLLLDTGADGESIVAKREGWHDPFLGELSEENARWVRDYGKWTRVDVSGEEGYSTLVGEAIDEISLSSEGGFGGVVRVRIKTKTAYLQATSGADELLVEVGAIDRR